MSTSTLLSLQLSTKVVLPDVKGALVDKDSAFINHDPRLGKGWLNKRQHSVGKSKYIPNLYFFAFGFIPFSLTATDFWLSVALVGLVYIIRGLGGRVISWTRVS